MTTPRILIPAAVLVLVSTVLIVYSNTYTSPFVFDDYPFFLEDPANRMTELSWDGIKTAALEGIPKNRWLPNASWALNYYFHGYDVYGYHLVNTALHLASGLLLFFFIRMTLLRHCMPAGIRPPARPETIAFCATLLWIVHPVHTQTVTYIYQRMTSMAALFFILALLLYAWGRNRWRDAGRITPGAIVTLTGSLLSGICAIISKQNAGMLPIIILLYEWFFFQDLSIKLSKRRWALIIGVLAIFGVIALLYLGGNPLDRILSAYTRRDFTLTERVMTEWRVVIYYISLFFFPSPGRLNLDHDYPLSGLLIQPPTTLASLGAVVALISMAVYLAPRHRLLSFCILWFFFNLLIESSVIGIEIIFEHRTYLPFMMAALFLISLIFRHIRPTTLTVALICAVALAFSSWTWQRNMIWRDEVSFWEDCVEKSPNDFRPHNDLGMAYFNAGDMQAAINRYRTALALKPGHLDTLNNMGNALKEVGQSNAAIEYYEKAIKISPGYAKARNNLAAALIEQQRYREALDILDRILNDKKSDAQAHLNAGAAFAHMYHIDKAVAHFQRALIINPDIAEAHNNLGVLLIRKKDYPAARSHFMKALRIRPDYTGAAENLEKLMKIFDSPEFR